MDLYFSLINTLSTTAPGFSRDYMSALSISDELYSPIMCNGNSMHAVFFCEYVRRVFKWSAYVWLSVCSVYGNNCPDSLLAVVFVLSTQGHTEMAAYYCLVISNARWTYL